MSANNKFDRDFWEVGISPVMYQFKEEEEKGEECIFKFDEQRDKKQGKKKTNQDESPSPTDTYEESDDQFRHQSILVNNDQFIHTKSIEFIKDKEFSYYKSDYFFASYIGEPQENHINKISVKGKKMLSIAYQSFFRLFGYQVLPVVNNNNDDVDKFFDFISKNKGDQSKNEDESRREWENMKLTKSDGDEIKYQPLELKDCNIGADDESIINWIIAFHNYGMLNHICFTFAIFFKDEDDWKYQCSTFSVAKKYSLNRCFVTFLSNEDQSKNISYAPYILYLYAKTNKQKEKIFKISEKKIEPFPSISNLFWLLTNEAKSEINIYLKEYNEINSWKTQYYDINSINYKFDLGIKEQTTAREKVIYLISSVFKLNCYLRAKIPFLIPTNIDCLRNFYEDAEINDKIKNYPSIQISTNKDSLITITNLKSKNNSLNLKLDEYLIYVGINGIEYGKAEPNQEHPPFLSHMSILSYLKLQAAYVDENMDKIYCVFTDYNNNNELRLVESDFGTTKLDDMKIIKKLKLEGKIINPQFKVNTLNHLFLIFQLDKKPDIYAFEQNKSDGSWNKVDVPKDESLIQNSNKSTNKSWNKVKVYKRCTLPVAVEISNKLFVMSDSNRLYHPAWRNYIRRHGIISTFYRFAFHIIPDSLVFEIDDQEGKKSEVVSAIIYPQIDIGFRGNIKSIFTSTDSPGIYEYSDRAFNYAPLKDLLPYTKTDCLFFNNGKLKVGLDRHRTKCQIAATALFGYACSIYGPGMMIRDFCIGKGNPYSRDSFQLIHNFLIAAYGTFLKMENDEELEYAIDVICEELEITENKNVYYNLMAELKKDYY